MHKRSFVAIMAVLLVAGMVSSAACEMTCNPIGPMTACCAQQMQQSHKSPAHAMTHSMDACTVSITSAQQCGHSQESAAVPAVSTQVLHPHATETISTPLTDISFIAGGPDTLSSALLNRSSFLAPLRI